MEKGEQKIVLEQQDTRAFVTVNYQCRSSYVKCVSMDTEDSSVNGERLRLA